MTEKDFVKLSKEVAYIRTLLDEAIPTMSIKPKSCPLCGSEFIIYEPFGPSFRKNAQCPSCGCLERHRNLWTVLKLDNFFEQIEKSNNTLKILQFMPDSVFQKKFEASKNVEFCPASIIPNDTNIPYVDITQMVFMQGYFDYVFAIHILERVEDDMAALKEFYRVLKTDGKAYIMSPISDIPKTVMGSNKIRRYSINDFESRLKLVGFNVVERKPYSEISEEERISAGLSESDSVFVCMK